MRGRALVVVATAVLVVASVLVMGRPAGAPTVTRVIAPAVIAPTPAPMPVVESSDDPRPVTGRRPVAPAPARPGRAAPIGVIEIPKIGLVHDIYSGIELSVLKYGPGHWPGTPMPGEPGNSVFAGHRTTHTRPFRHIDQLREGDEVHFTTGAGTSTYRVFKYWAVTPDEVWITDPTDESIVTFFACHPPGSARQRYVVRAKLVESPQPAVTEPEGPPAETRPAPTPLISI